MWTMELSVMPECYADTMLIECMVPPKNKYNHKNSCSRVVAEMYAGKFKDAFAVGIIDNDKQQFDYLKNFEVIDSVESSLVLLKHIEKSQYVIKICPALEQWVQNMGAQARIEHPYLRMGFTDLLRITKNRSASNDGELKNLFRAICRRDDLAAVRKLKNWIKVLIEKNYSVDINELKNV